MNLRLIAEARRNVQSARRTVAEAVKLVDEARNYVHARRLRRQVAELLKKRRPPG